MRGRAGSAFSKVDQLHGFVDCFTLNVFPMHLLHLLVCNAFVRTNCLLLLLLYSSVRLSVWEGMHCDHMVHISADLSLWLDSPILWAP